VTRLIYVYGTLQEVTRRATVAAANVYARDTSALDEIRQNAVFRDSPGELVLASLITDANIRFEYFALIRDATSKELSLAKTVDSDLPSCAAQNRQICMRDPNAANCIRFVQASACGTTNIATCDPVTSQTLMPIVSFPVKLHKATRITPAQSFGYVAGTAPCS
jgi:hypothetical protein